MMGGGAPPPQPKADGGQATSLMDQLGILWKYDRVAFDVSNPHPEFSALPAEYLFLTANGGNENAFNLNDSVSKGLEELVAIYAGSIEAAPGVKSGDVTALIATGPNSGLLEWYEFVDDRPNSMAMMMGGGQAARPASDPNRRIDVANHVVAAKINRTDDKEANAIFVTDVDMISDFFFQERTFGNLDFQFDNVTFVLNAVDSLAGVDNFMELRSRRPAHRSLKEVEKEKNAFLEDSAAKRTEADEKADEELEKAQERLSARVDEIEADDALDPIAKQQLLQQAQQDEQQRFSLIQAQIEQEKNEKIRQIDMETNREVAAIEANHRRRAIWLPPIPAILAGLVVLIIRLTNEGKYIAPARRR